MFQGVNIVAPKSYIHKKSRSNSILNSRLDNMYSERTIHEICVCKCIVCTWVLGKYIENTNGYIGKYLRSLAIIA